ncbi:hypothetical protein DBV15_07925 [Temnothorax longispinosus]|uniref:EGF-like domain-containing protein n=1 Tax=Temnothorax longispinosus TaxID=300112 RepID=A0A4S2JSC8_9HYME|nr:hypothetical protein DBV15_07925 [Temnothorax longispinosus]
MGLLNRLIAVLVIKILFLKVNAIPLVDDPSSFQLELKKDDAVETFNNSIRCNESQNVSRLVHNYTETYRYKPEHAMPGAPYQLKTRVNFKKEFHTELTCCEGYVQSGAMCVPRCPQSCQNGTCKEPDVCICNTGYRMLSNDSCVSACTNDCVNGTCVDPGVCICNEGYWLDSDGFTCRPVCPAQCEENHGYCTEPNSEEHICQPVCDFICWNGKCTAPNVCTCDPDHYPKWLEDDKPLNKIMRHRFRRAYEGAPYCYQCDNYLDNNTVCYVMQNYERNLTVSCFLNTDLPCYAMSRSNTLSNVTIIVWPFVILVILLVIGLIVAAYFMYRKRQKKKLATGIL